jgi:aspartate dehydrogenase
MITRLGIIGLGAIGQETLRLIEASVPGIEVVGALVSHPAGHAGGRWPIAADLAALLAARPDLVLECASQHAFNTHVPRILAAGCDVIAASVGGLADDAVRHTIEAAARSGDAQLFIPAGALVGIDALAAARLIGIDTVDYERSAPSATWASHETARGRDLTGLPGPHLVWQGSAREAALLFPKNANVAATIALAGIGFERTRVRLFADPTGVLNLHTIRAEGRFGRLHTEIASNRIGNTSSSHIVAGSLARGVLYETARIAV